MRKEKRDGLFMDKSIILIDENPPGLPILARLIQLTAILIGSWGFIGVLMDCIPVPADPFLVTMAMLFCIGLVFAFCLIQIPDLVKLFFGFLLYGLLFLSRFSLIQNGFYLLENSVIERLEAYYGLQIGTYLADYSTVSVDTTLIFVMIVVPVVSLLTVSIVRNRFTAFTGILLFLPIAISFLFGLIPPERYLIAYVAAVLYLTRASYSTRNVTNMEQRILLQRINGKAAVWLSLMALTIFLLLKLVVSEDEYNAIPQIKETKLELQTALSNFSFEDLMNKITDFNLFTPDGSAGGLNGGKLGKVKEVTFNNSEQLQITAPLEGLVEGVYLKGYVGSVYTGNSWAGHSKEADKLYAALLEEIPTSDFSAVNQFSGLIKRLIKRNEQLATYNSMIYIPSGEMQIEYKAANKKYFYAPYFTDYEAVDNINYRKDLYAVLSKKKDSYTLPYYYFTLAQGGSIAKVDTENMGNAFSGLYDDYFRYEKIYRDFVYEEYTQLPKKGLDRLKQEFSALKKDTAYDGVYDKISYVQTYLSEHAEYSLSPGKLPKGKDFVEYFLYENKKGYCAHFASAATLMLRAMGVPARYVEGYAVRPSDVIQNTIGYYETKKADSNGDTRMENVVSVKDYNAHSWVEVYIDNYGWIPVEVTPGSFVNASGIVQPGDSQNNSEKVSPTPSPTLTPTPTSTPEVTQKEDKKQKTAVTASNNKQIPPVLQFGLDKFMIGMVLVLLAILCFGTILLRTSYRKKLYGISDNNKKAIMLFAQIEKMLAVCQGFGERGAGLEDNEDYVKKSCDYIESEDFTVCMTTIRKARFGREKITEAELEMVEYFYQSLYKKAEMKLYFGKKMYLKLILLL